MNWFEMVNQTTEYIENHMTEDIDLKDIANECHVSYYYFIKTFSMITGYTLKEYIRNRRITLASYEVSNTKHRIIDIAIKYGYNSNESFSRAFKKIHGINPSLARKNNVTTYTHFPVLTYDIPKQNIISLSYEIVKDIEFDLVGTGIYIQEKGDYFDDAHELQNDFITKFISSHASKEVLYKVHHDISEGFRSYNYFVGYEERVFPKSNDLDSLHLSTSKAVKFLSLGLNKNLIFELKQIIYAEWEKNGFKSDLNFELEYVINKPQDKVDFFYIISIK